jgi:hypothetical protein
MSHLKSSVIENINSFILDQKKLDIPTLFTAVKFNGSTGTVRFRDGVDLQHVTPIQSYEYNPNYGTPLNDAIGETVQKLDTDFFDKNADRVIVVIYTDGQENQSHKFNTSQIKQLVEARQKSDRWSFLFLGANIDSFAVGNAYGFDPRNIANYIPSEKGMTTAYTATSASVGLMRSSGVNFASTLGGNLGESDESWKSKDSTKTPAVDSTPSAK